MSKAGRCGLSFLKNTCRGCRRHLVVWLVVLLSLYSIFYYSQYVTVENDNVKHFHRSSKVDRLSPHIADVKSVSVSTPRTVPTWGNISGLMQHMKPLFMKYSQSMKDRGSQTDFKLPWDETEVVHQSNACREPALTDKSKKATVIINLHDERIDRALSSLFRFLQLTDVHLVEDVILVGDIGFPGFYRDMYDLFTDYLPTFRLFISPKRTTSTQARKFAAKFAHGDVLVFLDIGLKVSKHWLGHMMAAISKYPTKIIQPMIIRNDTVFDDFGRPLFMHRREVQLDLTLKEFKIPLFPFNFQNTFPKQSIISSSAFALTKVLYSELRELEEYTGDTDLEMIVLSFKVWMCADGVITVPCACVTMRHSRLPRNTSTMESSSFRNMPAKQKRNLLFIASVWFGSYDSAYTCLLPKTRHVRLSYTDKRAVKLSKLFYNRLGCKKFPDFVSHVQPNLLKPPTNTTNYGSLSLYGHDLFMSRSDDGKSLTFVSNISRDSLPFIYSNNSLSINGMCVTYLQKASIKLTVCQNVNTNQKWLYTNGQLRLRRNQHLCIVKVANTNVPMVNLCKNANVLSRFNFTLSFVANCIK